MPAGRPCSFTQDIANTICQRLADGESLRAITRDDAMPGMFAVMQWLDRFPDFAQQYARARELQADTLFEMAGEIAHDGASDWVMTKRGPEVNQEHIARSRLRVDTIKWQAGKLAPKKYGERLMLDAAHAFVLELPASIAERFAGALSGMSNGKLLEGNQDSNQGEHDE